MLRRTVHVLNRTNRTVARTRLLRQSRACYAEKKKRPPLPPPPPPGANKFQPVKGDLGGLGPSMGQGVSGTGVPPPKLGGGDKKTVPRPPTPFQAATVAMEKEKLQLQNTSIFVQAQLEQQMSMDYFSSPEERALSKNFTKRQRGERKGRALLHKNLNIPSQDAPQAGDVPPEYEGSYYDDDEGEPLPPDSDKQEEEDRLFKINMDDEADDDDDGPAFGEEEEPKKKQGEEESDLDMDQEIADFEASAQEVVDVLEQPEYDEVDADPLLGPLYDMVLASKRRRENRQRRVEVLKKRFVEKKNKKYGEKNKLRRQTKRENKKKFLAMARKSPDWFHYPELNYWIHRSSLEHPHIRACLPVLLNNPTWTVEQKRSALDNMQMWIKKAADRTPEEKQNLTRVFQGVRTVPLRHTPDAYVEPDWKMPPTYEALIAAAEASMPPDELTRKREPPVKPYPKPVQF